MRNIIFFSFFSMGVCNVDYVKEKLHPASFDLRRGTQHSGGKHRSDDITSCDKSGKIYFEYCSNIKFPFNFSNNDKTEIEKAIADRDIRCQDITLKVYFTSEIYLRTSENTYIQLLDKNKKLYFIVYDLLTDLLVFSKDNQDKWVFSCGDEKRELLLVPSKEYEWNSYGYRQSQRVKVPSHGRFNYGQILLPPIVGTNDVDRQEIEMLIQNFEQPPSNETITVFAVYDELYGMREGDYYSLGEWMLRFKFLIYRTSVGDFFFIKRPESGWILLRKEGDKYTLLFRSNFYV